MVWGFWRLNIIWKLPWNDSEVILEILEIDSGSFFKVKVYFLNLFFDLKFIFRNMLEFWSGISTYTNKSRPGTLFKMCSRSYEYWRFQYHQKLLSRNRSCGLSKSNLLIFGQIWVGPNSEPVCYVATPSQFWNFLKRKIWEHLNHDSRTSWGLGCMILGSRVFPI